MQPGSAEPAAGSGASRLAALVRDPWTCFVYWEVDVADRRALWRRVAYDWSRCVVVLRLTEASSDMATVHDRAVAGWTGGCYRDAQPGRLYDLSLVIRLAGGAEIEVLRGGRIEMPEAEPSSDQPAFFARRDGRWIEAPAPRGGAVPAASGAGPADLDARG